MEYDVKALANWHVHHNYLFHVAGGGWVFSPLKLVLTLAYVHGSWLRIYLTAYVCPAAVEFLMQHILTVAIGACGKEANSTLTSGRINANLTWSVKLKPWLGV